MPDAARRLPEETDAMSLRRRAAALANARRALAGACLHGALGRILREIARSLADHADPSSFCALRACELRRQIALAAAHPCEMRWPRGIGPEEAATAAAALDRAARELG